MSTPSILVVDDELLIRDLLYDFFSSQGWNISVTESGTKALNLINENHYDLVLTDLKMPVMDGLALAAEVRAIHPELPIVLMTGYPSVDSAVQALRAKVADYITKPFNIHQLFKILKGKLEAEDN
jgi:DNA-binding NtrC family response regulator